MKRRNVFRVAVFYCVIAWATLQVADIVLPALNLPPWSITLVLALLALGFPIAVLLAWLYELTPEGFKREHEVDRAESITHATGRKIDFLIIAVLGVAVTVLLIDKFALDDATPPPAESAQSIAVLPFVNMGGTDETIAFSDGLAETLTHMLAQIKGLQVAARTSAFHFRDHTGEVAEIARQLNVRHLLEGSVQRWGDEISITAQLIDADNGFHLWSGNYRRSNLDNIFAIQEDIATKVVDNLHLKLLGSPSELEVGGTQNAAAYEEFLKGRVHHNSDSFESLPRAEAHYLKAIQLDPDYGRAYIELGETYLDMDTIGVLSNEEALAKAASVIEQAQELLGSTPQVLATLGRLHSHRIYRDGPAAVRHAEATLLQALEKEPDNVRALGNYASFLRHAAQRPAEAVQYAARGLKLDPRSQSLLESYGISLLVLDRIDEARDVFARLREYYPQAPAGFYLAARTEGRIGNFAESVRWYRASLDVDPADHEIPAEIARTFIAVFDPESAEKWVQYSLAIDPESVAARSALFDLYVMNEHTENGLELSRQLLEQGAPLRASARWLSLWFLMDDGYRNGDFSEFYDWMGKLYPELVGEPANINAKNRAFVSLLIRAYVADDQREIALRLKDRMFAMFAEQAAQDPVGNLNDEIILHATFGELDKALDKLLQLEESREYRYFWAFSIEPGIEALLNTERYLAIKTRVQAHLDRQRQIIHERGYHVVPQ